MLFFHVLVFNQDLNTPYAVSLPAPLLFRYGFFQLLYGGTPQVWVKAT